MTISNNCKSSRHTRKGVFPSKDFRIAKANSLNDIVKFSAVTSLLATGSAFITNMFCKYPLKTDFYTRLSLVGSATGALTCMIENAIFNSASKSE